MTSDRRMHWGALVFTLLIAIPALALLAGPLTAPLSPTIPTDADADTDEPVTNARTPLPQELHSRWYTQSLPPAIDVGATADVTIQFRNVGHVAWIKGTPSEVRLGEVGDRPLPTEMKVDWPFASRPAVQSEAVVHEDELATFSFKVAGAAPGTFRLHVRPVVDGVVWLEDEGVYVDITVR